ncbi:MAG: trypsin-like peptidase domain-containing protein [Candidatus Hydrogenedentes bacterium]|nr:trypsin-like peptidase domain-containing protein [Candidatus Hydrogenedentota bacterium]
MRTLRVRVVMGILVALVLGAQAAGADDIAVQGRAILDQYADTVITVKMVIKIAAMGSSEETPQEVTGTVIDPSGLIVVALSATDPMSMLKGMMGSMMGEFEMNTEVTDVQILHEDGSEEPAEIVLRDKDLDLAFVRPTKKPEEPVPCVDLAKAGHPEILDQLIVLNRLGKVARREHSASVERIESIVEKPRLFYIPGKDPTQSTVGSPAFTLAGEFVGIGVIRTIKSQGGDAFGMLGGFAQNMMVILVPAADIAEAAKQVPPYGDQAAAAAPAEGAQ